jgi:hypothetical protein
MKGLENMSGRQDTALTISNSTDPQMEDSCMGAGYGCFDTWWSSGNWHRSERIATGSGNEEY